MAGNKRRMMPNTKHIIVIVLSILVIAGIIQNAQAREGYIMNLILGALHDVILDNPSSGQVLTYNGTYWINDDVPNQWELLCTNELSVSATSLSCSNFPARRFLMVTVETRLVTSGVDIGIQFNGDTGNNYAWRKSANGGADTTAINDNNCLTQNPSAGMNQLHTLHISNNLASENKVLYGTVANSGASGAGNLAGRMEFACKWANTTNQITTITVMRDAGTGSYDVDSNISVWGYD